MSYAQITIVGRLGREPEVRVTQTGKTIVTGSIAVGTGDKTQWYKLQAWDRTGEWLKDAKKGDLVFAQGGLTIGTYEKKTGGIAIDAVVNAQVIRTSHKRESQAIEEAFGASAPRQSTADLEFDLPF
jgi:single-strand DNA-binding protein